jgi:uncharacterized phage-associated protein
MADVLELSQRTAGGGKMPRPYAPLAAANFLIIEFGKVRGIEHMKLQKLVYCAHGWWLTAFDSSFLNERPQIWRYGPVFESLYHVLKTFGRTPITSPQSLSPFERPLLIDQSDEDVRTLLHRVDQRGDEYWNADPFDLLLVVDGLSGWRVLQSRGI